MAQKLIILAVEKDRFMQIFLRDVFWMHGEGRVDLRIVEDTKEARKKVLGGLIPDIVIVDAALTEEPAVAGADGRAAGIELIASLKKLLPKANVVAFTASDDAELRKAALDAGADEYLVKGEHLPKELISVIYSLGGFTAK